MIFFLGWSVKSLPDFLADGAVRTQDPVGPPAESPERECERLRRELETVRGQLAEQTRRVESLTEELEKTRNKEHDYTQNLTKALEQVEKNLEKSNVWLNVIHIHFSFFILDENSYR